MNNLQDFQYYGDGQIPLCEIDGRVQCASSEFSTVNSFTNTVYRHPKIHVTREMLHLSKTLEESKALFLPVHMSFLKQLIQIYYEHGVSEVLETLSNHPQIFLSFTARFMLDAMAKINRVKTMLDPSLREPSEMVINRLSQTQNWLQSPMRCLAWHPVLMKVAVATSDDTVRIFSSEGTIVPILKCKQQKNVTCIAWRCMSNSDIAVGCENGIIVWNVDPNSVMTRPSMNHAIILHRVDHRPVTSIAWSPRGDVLASAAAHDSKILLWDVELDRTSILKRAGSMGHNLLKWSSSGEKLFAATTSYVFRVWDCKSWQAEKWSVALGRVQAAAWSADGKSLIFSTSEEPIIYGLTFEQSDNIFSTDINKSPNQAVPLYDLTKVETNGTVIGGIVQSIEWDPRGNHVAVLFHDTNSIVVFSVITKPVIQLCPGMLINGYLEEVPNIIAFQPHYEFGACLTISWSSGRIQHFPILYSDFCGSVGMSPPRNHMDSSRYPSPKNKFV